MIEFVRTRPWLNLGIASIALTVLSIMTSSVLFPMSLLGMLGTNTVLEIALTFVFSSLYVIGAHTAYTVGRAVSNNLNSKAAPVQNSEQQSLSPEAPKSTPSLVPALTTTPVSQKDFIILDDDYIDADDIYLPAVPGAGIEKTPVQPDASPVTPIRTPKASVLSVNISPFQLTPEISDLPIGSLTIVPDEAQEQTSEVSKLDETLAALHKSLDRALEVVQSPLVRSSPEVLAGTPNNAVKSPASTLRQATPPRVLTGTPTQTPTPISEMYTPSDSPVGSKNVSRSNGVHRSKAPVLNGFNHKRNSTPTKPCHICSDISFEAKKYGSMFEDRNGTTVRKSTRERKMAKYS